MLQWFAVKTHPRRELQVSLVLDRRGIETYLPRIPAPRRLGRGEAPLEPLFPGYLFSRLDLETNAWMAARSAPGVAYFLGGPGKPIAIPDDIVEGIRVRAEARARERRHPSFKRGDRVVIEDGPFYGLEAVFDGALTAAGRVRVLLAVLNRLVSVDLHIHMLRRAA